MDLVEIRKKAKKVKEKEGGEKAQVKSKATAKEKAGEKKAGKGKSAETPVDQKAKKKESKEKLPASHEEFAVGPLSEDNEMDQPGKDQYELSEPGVYEFYQEGNIEEAEDKEEEIEERIDLLCFMISDEEYAVNLFDVREIIKMADITDVPNTPPFVLGIISLRGVIIPLFDLRLRLGLGVKDIDKMTRIVIFSDNGKRVGMVVDAVNGVVSISKWLIEPTPSTLRNIDADLLSGVARYDDRLLIFPNLSKVASF